MAFINILNNKQSEKEISASLKFTVFLLILFIPFVVEAQTNTTTTTQVRTVYPMVLVYNTSLSYGTSIAIPLAGSVNVDINWGDGSSVQHVGSPGWKTHTYTTNVIYLFPKY